MNIITRNDAMTAGLQRFFTGKPCKRGHISERYIVNRNCVTCQLDRQNKARDNELLKIRKREVHVAWYAENKEKKLSYMSKYNKHVAVPRKKEKYKQDHVFALEQLSRARLSKAMQRFGYAKNGKTQEFIGCSYEDLVTHLESQFTDGMNWENRGEWHIDHIMPIATAKTEADLLALFHFTNLRPLWAIDNRRKGSKVIA